jgi:hypothetical protein
MASKRETTMSAGEGPSGGGVNPMPEARVLDWILSDSDEGPSSDKEERASERYRSGRGACLTFSSTSVWQLRRGVLGAAKEVYRTSSLTLATTMMTTRQVSLNFTAFLLVLYMELKVV